MNDTEQYYPSGSDARSIAADVEDALRRGRLRPGAKLPPVRALAAHLRVSPTTVAAAYGRLRSRGIVGGQGRRGTRVSPRPPLPVRPVEAIPPGVRNLAEGNPDPALVPTLERALARLDPSPSLYGEQANLPALLEIARADFSADAIDVPALAVTGGAGDGIERVLTAHLRPGDRVALEDPGFTRVLDLIAALGLVAEPVALDEFGIRPDGLASALRRGARAVVVTPRAQNPTGAAFDEGRAAALRKVLGEYPDVLVVEDDHAGAVAAVTMWSIAAGRARWAVVRSVSKSLGPDLRLAFLTGDSTTVGRVEGRQLLGTGWVSHVLQGLVVALWHDPDVRVLLARATATYAARRDALCAALREVGVPISTRSGWNAWVPVREETSTVSALLQSGWAVAAGERYRMLAGPAIRVTASTLEPDEAGRLADDLARVLRPAGRTYTA